MIGVIGPVAPDYFAENIGDRCSARVTWSRSSAQLIPAAAVGSTTARSAGRYALPRLDECAQDRIVRAALGADCEIVINLDAYLVPRAVTRLRSSGARVAFWFLGSAANLWRQLMLLAPYDIIREEKARVFRSPAVGKEVLTFHDFNDLVGQAARTLSERGLIVRFSDAATQCAHRDHIHDLRVTATVEKLS